jgi:hypothetical protein
MKMAATLLIGSLTVFHTSLAAAQQPTMTQFVAQNAMFSLVVRPVNDLKERGDEMSAEFGHPATSTSLFSMVRAELLVGGVTDDTLPFGVMWFEPELIGEPAVKQQPWKQPAAAGVAISDSKKLAEMLKVDHDELKSGKVFKRGRSTFGHENRFYKLVDRYLWIVSHEKLYEVVAKAKPLSQVLPPSRLESLDSADLLLAVWPDAKKKEREVAEQRAEQRLAADKRLDDVERASLREMHSIIASASYVVGTVRLDRGIEANFNVFFDQAALPELRQRIQNFSPPGDGVTLAGLPPGKLLFGHAARTDSSGIQSAISATVRRGHGLFWPVWNEMHGLTVVTQLEGLKILGLFGEIWPLVDRYKVGLYRNTNPGEQGLVTLAAILDTDDPQRLIRELQTLAALVDRSAFGSPDNADDRENTHAIIRKLIVQLGDINFEQRQSATTRLVIIGEPALPLLKEARGSDVPEISRRSGRIETLIQEDLKERRDKALGSSVLAKAKPVFIYHPEAEERVDASVHVMEVRIQEDSELRPQLRFLAGPEWSRIRLVALKKHVIVLFGSDLKLLDQTIENLRQAELGGEVFVPETPYGQPLLRPRGAEFQGSIARIARLMKPPPLTDDHRNELQDPALSSAAVTLEPDFFSVEWRLSLPDLKAILNQAF